METTGTAAILALALIGFALNSGITRDKTAEIYGEVGDRVQGRAGGALRWENDAIAALSQRFVDVIP